MKQVIGKLTTLQSQMGAESGGRRADNRGFQTKQNTRRKTLEIYIKYDVMRTKNLPNRSKNIGPDTKQLRGNATLLQRDAVSEKHSESDTDATHTCENQSNYTSYARAIAYRRIWKRRTSQQNMD